MPVGREIFPDSKFVVWTWVRFYKRVCSMERVHVPVPSGFGQILTQFRTISGIPLNSDPPVIGWKNVFTWKAEGIDNVSSFRGMFQNTEIPRIYIWCRGANLTLWRLNFSFAIEIFTIKLLIKFYEWNIMRLVKASNSTLTCLAALKMKMLLRIQLVLILVVHVHGQSVVVFRVVPELQSRQCIDLNPAAEIGLNHSSVNDFLLHFLCANEKILF